jgi:alkylation response protein AidB-like acyl-CoA dehydrogenase
VPAASDTPPSDSRVQSTFGGTTEIQKEIIARNLGL